MLIKWVKIELMLGIMLALTSCGFGPSGSGKNTSDKACAEMSKEECNSQSFRCVYNIDACRDKFKENDQGIPEGLGTVKKLAMDGAIYVIDSDDRLWGFGRFSMFQEIYPHPSKSYSDITVIHDNACAITKDGKVECFKNGRRSKLELKNQAPLIFVAPHPYDQTACGVENTQKLVCESDTGLFEKLADKWNKLANGTPNPPKIVGLWMSPANTINLLLDNNDVRSSTSDQTSPDGWRDFKTPIGKVSLFAHSLNSTCFISTGGILRCEGGAYDASGKLSIPNDLKAEKIIQVATNQGHTCAIKEADNELVCWGSKKLLENIPKGLKGVKQVAVGPFDTCIINKNDKLECFKQQD